MNENRKPDTSSDGGEKRGTYDTFPCTTTHGPHDKRSYHGKPEDWARNNVKRDFGGKLKNG